MLQNVALLPLLLAPAANGSAPTRDLLAALPENTFLAVHAPDPRALVAARETNDWIAFAMDPEWDAIAGQLLTQFDENALADEMTRWRQMLLRALADSTGFVAFVGEGFGEGDPVLGIIAEGGPDASALLRTFLPSDAATVEIAGGREVLVSEAGRGEIYYEANGVILVLSTPTVEIATRMAAECLDALDGAQPRGPFAVPGVAQERRPAALEFAVDMSQLWSELERVEAPEEGIMTDLFDAAASMEWMYGSVTLGEGETSDWEFVMPYGEATLLGQALGFLGEADADLLDTIPAGATSGLVAAFDVSGFTDWVLGVVRDTSEEAHGEALAAIGAVTETTGIDLMDDVLHNLTGQFMTFSAPTPTPGGELIELTGTQASTIVATVEDTDALIDLVENLLDLSGMGGATRTETAAVAGDEDGMEVWRIDPGVGFEVAVATGAGRFAVSTDAEGFDRYMARLGGDATTKRLLDDPALAAAAGTASGALVSVQETAAAADAIQASVANIESMISLADPTGEAANEMRPVVEAIDRMTALIQRYFEGTVVTELKVDQGRIRYRTRTR